MTIRNILSVVVAGLALSMPALGAKHIHGGRSKHRGAKIQKLKNKQVASRSAINPVPVQLVQTQAVQKPVINNVPAVAAKQPKETEQKPAEETSMVKKYLGTIAGAGIGFVSGLVLNRVWKADAHVLLKLLASSTLVWGPAEITRALGGIPQAADIGVISGVVVEAVNK